MAVPNTFATATSAIPLANLDANFAYYDGAFSISGAATTFSGAVTLTSNLTFTGTGNRITGDFSNATYASRVLFQTSTTNGASSIGVIPNGTGVNASLFLDSDSAATNSSRVAFQMLGGSEARLSSAILGTGTYLPMTFYTGGSERMRLDTSGNVGIGTSSPNLSSSSTALTVNTATAANYAALEIASAGTLNFYINANNAASYINSAGTRPMVFYTNSAERMRIDSSGNVGIGTSAPAYSLDLGNAAANGTNHTIALFTNTGSNTFGFQFPSTGTNRIAFLANGSEWMSLLNSGNVGIGQTSPQAKLQINTAADGAQIIVVGAQTANEQTLLFRNSYYTNNATGGIAAIGWIDSGSSGGSLTFKTGANGGGVTNIPSERMRIDQAGNVGIGTSSPGGKLDVSSSGQNIVISRSTGSYGAFQRIAPTGQQTYDFYTINGVEVARITGDPSYLSFATGSAGSERMRITSGGSLLVGTITATTAPAVGCQLLTGGLGQISIGHDTSAVSGNYYASFAYNSGVIGSIAQSGTTAVLYNVTSDQRLKENIQDAESSSALIDALQVRQFDWKTDNTHQRYGFIAQELVTVAPEAVHQPINEEEMMAVDYSKLVPMLVKEIQSLRKRLTALEST